MNDCLIKAIGLNEEVKIYIVETTEVVNTAINKHDLWPSAASVLGKTMTIALLMGGSLKGDQAMTIKIDGNGPIGQVIVDTNSFGVVRGYVTNPHVTFSKKNKIDEIATLGYNGYIDVIKDLKLNDLFTSSIEINTGDLAKDFTYYLMKSEQIPSAILLGSQFGVDNRCQKCGGMIVQLMPNASEETISYLESVLTDKTEFSKLLLEHENIEEILDIFFGDKYKILEKNPVHFICPCSHEKFKYSLAKLGTKEIQEMIDEDKDIEVVCHYCSSKYNYTVKDLEEIKNIISINKNANN